MNANETEQLLDRHLPRIHADKVRNSYRLSGRRDGTPLRLVYASDRISVFDEVLPFRIPQKGEILHAMSIFNRELVAQEMPWLRQDLVAYGEKMLPYLPPALRAKEVLARCMVVLDLDPAPTIETIVRGYLFGSAAKAYDAKKGSTFCGQMIPPGLRPGSKFEKPLFTPTTKAPAGQHDDDLDSRIVPQGFGERGIAVYRLLVRHGAGVGIILVDTKLEFNAELVLCDEVGTPDSSRFWSAEEYQQRFPDRLPDDLDKEFVRKYKRGDLKDMTEEALVQQTHLIYRYIMCRWTGQVLEEFQRSRFGI